MDIFGTEFNDNNTTQLNGTSPQFFPSLIGSSGNDFISGFGGNDILFGGDGGASFDGTGNRKNNTIRGTNAANRLNGADGNGAIAAIRFASLTGASAFTAAEFTII